MVLNVHGDSEVVSGSSSGQMIAMDAGITEQLRREGSVTAQRSVLQLGERHSVGHDGPWVSQSLLRKQIFVEKEVDTLNFVVRAHAFPQDREEVLLSSDKESVYEEEVSLIDNLRAEGGEETLEEEPLEGVQYLMGEHDHVVSV